MKKLLVSIILFFLIFGVSCGNEEQEISRISIGKVISVDDIGTSCNEYTKVQIKTEKAFFVIEIPLRYFPGMPIGSEIYVVIFDNDDKYYVWQGSVDMHKYKIRNKGE